LNHLLIQYKDRVEELIIRLAWEAGLTRPEIAALEWKDISLDDGLIHLSNRSVHMEDDLRHCLEARYDLFPPPQYPYVVITDGRKMHPCDGHIGLLVAKAMDSEEALFGIRLNDLRDDYIIRLLEKEGINNTIRKSGVAISTLRALYKEYIPSVKEENTHADALDPYWDEEKLEEILHSEGASPVGIGLYMIMHLGMTITDIISLTWEQIDFERNLILLPTKQYPLDKRLMQILKEAADSRDTGGDPHVLLRPKSGKPFSTSRLNVVIQTALISVGLDNIKLADLGNAAADRAIDEKVFEFIRENGYIQNKHAVKLLNVCYPIANRELHRMAEQRKLLKKGPIYYLPSDLIDCEIESDDL